MQCGYYTVGWRGNIPDGHLWRFAPSSWSFLRTVTHSRNIFIEYCLEDSKWPPLSPYLLPVNYSSVHLAHHMPYSRNIFMEWCLSKRMSCSIFLISCLSSVYCLQVNPSKTCGHSFVRSLICHTLGIFFNVI